MQIMSKCKLSQSPFQTLPDSPVTSGIKSLILDNPWEAVCEGPRSSLLPAQLLTLPATTTPTVPELLQPASPRSFLGPSRSLVPPPGTSSPPPHLPHCCSSSRSLRKCPFPREAVPATWDQSTHFFLVTKKKSHSHWLKQKGNFFLPHVRKPLAGKNSDADFASDLSSAFLGTGFLLGGALTPPSALDPKTVSSALFLIGWAWVQSHPSPPDGKWDQYGRRVGKGASPKEKWGVVT